MHNITHISDEDRARLVYLTEALRIVGTVEEQQQIRADIAEIETRRKPLHECNMAETTELRTSIWEKFDKLNRAGKFSIAQQFKVMLQFIEMRQHTLYREMAMEEAMRLAQKRNEQQTQLEAAKTKKAKKAERAETGEESQKKTSFSNRWMTNTDDLD